MSITSAQSDKDLDLRPLDEKFYKVELDLPGKSQDFASELLKLYFYCFLLKKYAEVIYFVL